MKKNVVKINENTLRQIVAESIKEALKRNFDNYFSYESIMGNGKYDDEVDEIIRTKCANEKLTKFSSKRISNDKYSFVAEFGNGTLILKGVAKDYYDGGCECCLFHYEKVIYNGKKYPVSLEHSSHDSNPAAEIEWALYNKYRRRY